MNKPIYALSIKQPYAWLICKGFKDIENRDWRIGRNPNYGLYKSETANFRIELPQRIYVHAGVSKSELSKETLDWILKRLNNKQAMELMFHYKIQTQVPCLFSLGAIVGEVTITDCVTESESLWFIGKYGFVLVDPVLYDRPILCKGQLGFFKPEIKQ